MTPTLFSAARRAAVFLFALATLSACDSTDGGGGLGAPNAVAGADQAADVGTPVTLDASASTDPDGDPLTFSWAFVTTPAGSAATLSATSAQTTFTPDAPGAYVARVTVSDGSSSDTDEVTITVAQPTFIDLEDDVTTDTALPAGAYRVAAGRTLRVDGAALTLSPGVRIDFGAGAGLQVNGDGALIANGTPAQPILLQGATAGPGYWLGVAIYSNDPRNAMTHVTVAHGGGDRYSLMDVAANVALDNGTQLTLANATLRQSGAFGLSLDAGARLPGFAANAFADNADAPARVNFGAAGALDAASSFASNADGYVLVTGTNATDDLALAALDVPYRFDSNVAVDGALLTVAPGARFVFGAGAGLTVNGDAALAMNGSASAPIDLRGASETPGFWDGIAIYSNDPRNVMTYVTVAHGGGERYSLLNEAANVALDNGTQLTLANATLRQSGAFGLSLDAGARLPGFAANTFSGNTDAGVQVPFEAAGQLDAASAYAANGGAYVAVTDTDAQSDLTLAALDAPYRFDSNVAVDGALLTVAPGARFVFSAGAGLTVNADAAIRAVGTPAAGISMVGEQPTQGYWDGLAIYSNDTRNVLDYVTLSHGGLSRYSLMNERANLSLDNNTRATVTNSTVTDSGGWGIQADAGVALTQSGNAFANNALGNVNQD